MLLPCLPTFPDGLPSIDEKTFEKIARKTLIILPSVATNERLKLDENELVSESFELSREQLEKLSCLHTSYVDAVSRVWYSNGPSISKHFARQTATNKPRVKDISWSIWTQLASCQSTEEDGEPGVQLIISTDRGVMIFNLSYQEVARLHRETVRIQAEIDKLLEGAS
ncbi:hypothetical protein DICVIV_04756 [Dictyocaulus viviparus]|uniref:COMM domain-containing protein n=1 Tax=Dictyocaulus viviparus TaxID=29172 RepID=A0A0D8Y3G3_DICVI|nr:hypothetical protein DICVIV_04756 [Dictyocaulus viviparus]